jgi:hypothetical protein
MKEYFQHKTSYGSYYGIRLSSWWFFAIFFMSFESWGPEFVKTKMFSFKFAFKRLCLPTRKTRKNAMDWSKK